MSTNNEIQEKEAKHDYEQYPFGSYPRLLLAFKELTGIDLGCAEFLDKKEKRGDEKNVKQ